MSEVRGQTSLERVVAAAAALQLPISVMTFPQGTRTAADAAAACHCDVAQIVKSMVFAADHTLVLILVSGAHRADLHHLKAHHGLALTKADAGEVRTETGFAIGGVAPIGHIKRLPVYMDETLFTFDTVWCAAGRPDNVFSVSPTRLQEATGAISITVVG